MKIIQVLLVIIAVISIFIGTIWGMWTLLSYIDLKANEGCSYKQGWKVEVEWGEDIRYRELPLEQVKELSKGRVIYPVTYKSCN